MIITFYKDYKILFKVKDIHDFTKCSTGDVDITLNDETNIIIKREQYDWFGCCVE